MLKIFQNTIQECTKSAWFVLCYNYWLSCWYTLMIIWVFAGVRVVVPRVLTIMIVKYELRPDQMQEKTRPS